MLASTNLPLRLVSHVPFTTGVPTAGVAGHSMVASAGQLVTVGALLSISVMVCDQVTDLLSFPARRSSDLVLLTSLPLTPRLASTNVTVRLVSHVSLKTGVPNTGVEIGRASCRDGQLITVGALLSITVMV